MKYNIKYREIDQLTLCLPQTMLRPVAGDVKSAMRMFYCGITPRSFKNASSNINCILYNLEYINVSIQKCP